MGPSPPSRTVFINDGRSGAIWTSLHWRRILAGHFRSAPLLRTVNAIYSQAANAISRPIPFTCVCFSSETARSNHPSELHLAAFSCLMAAVDQRGFIYIMDFLKNKWTLVARTGVSGTCAAFNIQRRRELFVALSDCSIHCVNTGKSSPCPRRRLPGPPPLISMQTIDTGQLVAKLPAHHLSKPRHISTHPTESLAITSSDTEAILWQTETFTQKRVLMGAASVGVQQACFDPTGVSILGHFSDGSVLVWSVATFDLTWRFTINTNPPPSSLILPKQSSHVAISHDREFLVLAGRSGTLRIWNIIDQVEIQQVTILDFDSQHILQLDFVGTSDIVSVLSSAGQVLFANIKTAQILGRASAENTYKSFAISPDGTLLSTIMADSRHIVSLLRLDAILTPQLDESPATEEPVEVGQSAPLAPSKPVPTVIATRPKTFHELVETREDSNILNKGRLRRFLDQYGRYPEKYRVLIWRFLLKLPENREAFDVLMGRGLHPSVKDFRKRFPLKSYRLAKTMERILSSLCYWSPLFEAMEYLPSLVFPFAYLMVNDTFMCFEVLMTLLLNWCQKWWEYYPNPPVELLSMFEELMMHHDCELLAHFVKYKVTSQVYVWTFVQSLFSELFVREEWLRVMDHLITNGPAYIWYLAAAYLIHFKPALLRLDKLDDFKFFFQRPNPVALSSVLSLAYRLRRTTPEQLSPATFLEAFVPIPRGQYPVFNRFPKFVVDYQVRMRERIRKEEEDYLRKRKTTEEIKRLTEELRRDKKVWQVQDKRMNDMVDKWWDSMIGEDKSHEAAQARLDAMELEQRAKALREIGEARRAFIDHTLSVARQQATTLSRAVGENRRAAEERLDKNALDAHLGYLSDEWLERRDQVLRAREENKKREMQRVQRFAEKGREAGAADLSLPRPMHHDSLASDSSARVARAWFGSPRSSPIQDRDDDDVGDGDGDERDMSEFERELKRINQGKSRCISDQSIELVSKMASSARSPMKKSTGAEKTVRIVESF
ncbi:hypothetical protein SeMB42_g04226 [Synchytrium endobioticum]|uniref:TBC1 domain family member 31 n=1 Tax=Synchytrium endobioticum TaxID=286115 RepID=A0A507CKG6_9FUNG|nr:hypothetical protein SeLEV6574_g06679 [Synchytrium endobioticum]TPX44764.1 hypothetical protein SeMB42_g04226 [Synchytrium endobioticum]